MLPSSILTIPLDAFDFVLPILLTNQDGDRKIDKILTSKKFGIPIKWVGVGEGIDDLEPFNAKEFVENII